MCHNVIFYYQFTKKMGFSTFRKGSFSMSSILESQNSLFYALLVQIILSIKSFQKTVYANL
jgi:hypothetical protein